MASSTRKRHVVTIGRPICGLLWLLRRRMTPFLFTWKVAQVCRIFFRGRPLIRVVLDRRGRVKHFPDALIFRNSLSELSLELYNRNIQSFIMECGPDLAFSALRSGIIHKVFVFVAPKILGGREVPAVGGEGFERLSDSIRCETGRLIRRDRTSSCPLMFTGRRPIVRAPVFECRNPDLGMALCRKSQSGDSDGVPNP